MLLTTMNLANPRPRYLEQIFISLGCSRYRGSTELVEKSRPKERFVQLLEAYPRIKVIGIRPIAPVLNTGPLEGI